MKTRSLSKGHFIARINCHGIPFPVEHHPASRLLLYRIAWTRRSCLLHSFHLHEHREWTPDCPNLTSFTHTLHDHASIKQSHDRCSERKKKKEKRRKPTAAGLLKPVLLAASQHVCVCFHFELELSNGQMDMQITIIAMLQLGPRTSMLGSLNDYIQEGVAKGVANSEGQRNDLSLARVCPALLSSCPDIDMALYCMFEVPLPALLEAPRLGPPQWESPAHSHHCRLGHCCLWWLALAWPLRMMKLPQQIPAPEGAQTGGRPIAAMHPQSHGRRVRTRPCGSHPGCESRNHPAQPAHPAPLPATSTTHDSPQHLGIQIELFIQASTRRNNMPISLWRLAWSRG